MNERKQSESLFEWAFGLKLAAKPRLALLALVHEANPETELVCAPMEFIGYLIDLSESQARRYVRGLMADGIVTVVQASGGRKPCTFGFCRDKGVHKQPSISMRRIDYTQPSSYERRVKDLNPPPMNGGLSDRQGQAGDGATLLSGRSVGNNPPHMDGAFNPPSLNGRVEPPLRIPPSPSSIPSTHKTGGKENAKASRPRKSTNRHPELTYPVKEALVTALDYQPGDVNKTLEGQLFKVASQLVDCENPVLPDEVVSLVGFAKRGEKGNFSIWWIAPKVAEWRKWQRGTHSPVDIRTIDPALRRTIEGEHPPKMPADFMPDEPSAFRRAGAWATYLAEMKEVES